MMIATVGCTVTDNADDVCIVTIYMDYQLVIFTIPLFKIN